MARTSRSAGYKAERKLVDLTTILGLVSAIGLLVLAIVTSSGLALFFNPTSILIVLGGTLGVVIASSTFKDIQHSLTLVGSVFLRHEKDYSSICYQLIQLAQFSRTKGILALQNHLNSFPKSGILYIGITMLCDGVLVKDIEEILYKKSETNQVQRANSISILRRAGEIAHAMGLIGTLVGLVQMLGNMQSPEDIGPAMAVALLTTFYGAVLANLVFNPLANKLELIGENDNTINQLFIVSILSMGRMENPRRLEVIMNTILPPSEHIKFYD